MRPSMVGQNSSVVRTICGFCTLGCGMKVTANDGRIEKVEGDPGHPANAGDLCEKRRTAAEVVYSPLRLTRPMKKTPAGHVEISWNEAFGIIAAKLRELKEKYGPAS